MSNPFFKLALNPFKFRIFLITKLPAAYFSGLRVVHADESKTMVSVPYKRFTTNPFKSTYFACLSMAAEMTTGLLAMAHTYKSNPAVSMLIVKTEGNFFKKATGLTTFTCEDGKSIKLIVEEAKSSGLGTTFTATSVGRDEDENVIAEFTFTWSIKRK
jgi:acyl-coenzyme A thioesterase PaaI-like protein